MSDCVAFPVAPAKAVSFPRKREPIDIGYSVDSRVRGNDTNNGDPAL
jgi:hypothetical protein